MSVPRRQEIQEIFAAALDVESPAERQRWLAAACRHDASLRQEVDDLLAAYHDAGAFLEGPDETTTVGGDASLRTEVKAVGRIDSYQLLEVIGEGGMGVVYRAEQQSPVRRTVALKVIRPGLALPSVIARFEAERQALALMDHPNIARVFEGGTTADGCPYFAMELVRGEPITAYCEQQRLTFRERLELFLAVCRGVQHAHQRAIIHRDLKPSNILVTRVDGHCEPKVIDFGIAKTLAEPLTQRTFVTHHSQLLGTPLYMSPEQAAGDSQDIDTRSDVYSLGVVLYELLAGSTPFTPEDLASKSYDEFRRILREDEPPRPSQRVTTVSQSASLSDTVPGIPDTRQLRNVLRGELDWLVMKALEKDRTRRYDSVQAFAADIERFLRNEPVLACPPAWSYRCGKFVRRHRAAVAISVALCVLLSAGILGTTLGLVRARNAESAALAAANRESELRRDAEGLRDQAQAAQRQAENESRRASEEAAIARSVTDFLRQDLLQQADPDRNSREKKLTVEELLDRAAQRVSGRFDDQPRVEAAIRLTIGATYHRLGKLEDSRVHLERSARLFHETLGADAIETLEALSQLAEVYQLTADLDRAEELCLQVYEGRRRRLGDDHDSTLSAVNNLASLYMGRNQFKKAEPLLVQTWEKRRRFLGDEHEKTLVSLSNLAVAQQSLGKIAEAEAMYEQLFDKLPKVLGQEHSYVFVAGNNYAIMLNQRGRSVEAETLLKRLLPQAQRVLGRDHPKTLVLGDSLGATYLKLQKPELAAESYRWTWEARERVLGVQHPKTLLTANNLGKAWQTLGKLDEAERLFVHVLKSLGRSPRPEDAELAITCTHNLARLYATQKQWRQAAQRFEEALALSRQVAEVEPVTTAVFQYELARAYQNTGRLEDAESLFGESFRTLSDKRGPQDAETLKCMESLAVLCWRSQKLERSVALFEELLQRQSEKFGADAPETLRTKANLGINYRDAGRVAEGIALLEEHRQKSSPSPPAEFRIDLIEAYLLADRRADAVRLTHEKLMSDRATLAAGSLPWAHAMATSGKLLLDAGQCEEAETVLRDALTVFEPQAPDLPRTTFVRGLIGASLLGQKKFEESESHLIPAYERLAMNSPPSSTAPSKEQRFLLEMIVQLYESWDHPAEAERWRAKRPAGASQRPPPDADP